MKIKMNSLLAGPAGIMEAGRVYDVDPAQAQALAANGYAEIIDPPAKKVPAPPVVETMALQPEPQPEQAVQPRPRGPRPRGRGKSS